MSVENLLPVPVPNIGFIDNPGPSPILSSNSKTEESAALGDPVDNVSSNIPATTPRARSENTTQPELTIKTTATYFHDFKTRSDEDEPPQSVIHAPPGFREFKITPEKSFDSISKSEETPSNSDMPMNGHSNGEAGRIGKKFPNSPISPPPITTAIEPAKDWSDRATPRAQTRQDFDDIDRRSHTSSLDDIPEGIDAEKATGEVDGGSDVANFTIGQFPDGEAEIKALKAALAECWSLCNTLARLSYIHRERFLKFDESIGMQENAWKSCWRLCQELYDSQNDDHASQVNPTLDLCREFCQTLFETRIRDNEIADSVLRVSFELNNHLYNTHDRNLPEAFRERTLDFYITLCHRLMKQRTRASETDSLLSACWSLAEMLFSIRQSKREARRLDEELLGSAVQACWELCDIFREGWTQRSFRSSDRGTPRPSQATFAHTVQQVEQSQLDLADDMLGNQVNPETPTTIFDDTATISPDDAPIQNIFVLGQAAHTKWSSNSSSVSGQTQSSEQTSSTNTITMSSNDPNLISLRVLINKAAMNSGFQRDGSQSLSAFVKSLSSDTFGSTPWQISLLKNYKKLVAFDPAFRNVGHQARSNAVDIARAVQAVVQSGQYSWLRDLYRLVFGFHIEEATNRKGIMLQA